MKRRIRGSNIFFILVAIVGILALGGGTQPAEACMGSICCTGCEPCGGGLCCEECHPCETLLESQLFGIGHQTQVEFLSHDQARVTVMGYLTTHLETGLECITTLAPVPGIRSIDAVTNYNTLTGEPFLEVSFTEDFNASQGLAQIAKSAGLTTADAPWQGFISHIVGNVEDGVLNHFVVDVTLEKGVTPDDFLKSLREYGAYITASSEGGFPNGGHAFIRVLGDNPIIMMNDDLKEGLRTATTLP